MDRHVARAGRLQPQAGTSTGARAPRRLRRALAVAAFAVAALAAGASTASASVAMCDVPITMSDGVVLRANIWLPSTSGHYPTRAHRDRLQQGRRQPDRANARTRPRGSSRAPNRRSPKRASR